MNLVLNGGEVELLDGASISDAVQAAGHTGSNFGIAVALNGEVVPRGGWGDRRLEEGDRVEVLVAAQGG
jgi:sulfur carrier protein